METVSLILIATHAVREIMKNRFLQFHPDLSPFPYGYTLLDYKSKIKFKTLSDLGLHKGLKMGPN